MILRLLLIFGFVMSLSAQNEEQDRKEIMAVLDAQQKAWSENNIDKFMDGYWKSDSLQFYGARGLTSGWQKTLENYKKAYPTAEKTGTLNFKIESMTKVEKGIYYLMGRYYLTLVSGQAEGVFMVIFKKINGEWKIIADLSC